MANLDKNLVITPSVGSSSEDPKIVFSGADTSTGAQSLTARIYPTSNGTLAFEGSAGQLFSITNSLTGTVYSVNDGSGLPSIEVFDSGVIRLARYSGRVVIGNIADNGVDTFQFQTGTSISFSNVNSTGNISALSYTSTVATGTSPFLVNSTTLVANLNADLLDGQSGAYYLDWTNVTNKPDPVVTVTLTGDVTGSANATLTDLGSGTITIATTVAGNSVALGTDTTGNYVASITNGSFITGADAGSEGAALTLAVDATSASTASKVVARDATGSFSANTVTATTFSGSGALLTNIPNSATTASSANGASTIVARDAAGSFTTNVINATEVKLGTRSINTSMWTRTFALMGA